MRIATAVVLAAALLLCASALGQPSDSAFRWADRYFRIAEFTSNDHQLRSTAVRIERIGLWCNADTHEVVFVLAGLNYAIARKARNSGWWEDQTPALDPFQLVRIMCLVLLHERDINGGRQMSKGECSSVLEYWVEESQQDWAAAVVELPVDDVSY